MKRKDITGKTFKLGKLQLETVKVKGKLSVIALSSKRGAKTLYRWEKK